MAIQIDCGEYAVKRTDNGFFVDPRAIVVDWSKNLSRAGATIDIDDDFKTFAFGLLPVDKGGRGQIQPVRCRILSDRRPELIAGFRRLRAMLWLVDQGHDVRIHFNTAIRNDLDAALDNLTENLDRLDPKPIQLATAIVALRESYGLNVDDIAARFRRTGSWVRQLESLVSLPEQIKDAVKNGKVSKSAAIEIAKIPDTQEQIATFNEVKTTKGTIKAKDVQARRQAKRDAAIDATEVNGEAPLVPPVSVGPKRPPSRIYARDLRPILEDVAKTDGENADGRKLANAILDYMAATMTEKQFNSAWRKTFPL